MRFSGKWKQTVSLYSVPGTLQELYRIHHLNKVDGLQHHQQMRKARFKLKAACLNPEPRPFPVSPKKDVAWLWFSNKRKSVCLHYSSCWSSASHTEAVNPQKWSGTMKERRGIPRGLVIQCSFPASSLLSYLKWLKLDSGHSFDNTT